MAHPLSLSSRQRREGGSHSKVERVAPLNLGKGQRALSNQSPVGVLDSNDGRTDFEILQLIGMPHIHSRGGGGMEEMWVTENASCQSNCTKG